MTERPAASGSSPIRKCDRIDFGCLEIDTEYAGDSESVYQGPKSARVIDKAAFIAGGVVTVAATLPVPGPTANKVASWF